MSARMERVPLMTAHLKRWKGTFKRSAASMHLFFVRCLEIHTTSLMKLSVLCNQVLQELMGDRSLEKFRVEYEKLHRALKKSHDSEKRLMQKCRELNADIVAHSSKVATALKLSQEDQATIASLKKVSFTKIVFPVFHNAPKGGLSGDQLGRWSKIRAGFWEEHGAEIRI